MTHPPRPDNTPIYFALAVTLLFGGIGGGAYFTIEDKIQGASIVKICATIVVSVVPGLLGWRWRGGLGIAIVGGLVWGLACVSWGALDQREQVGLAHAVETKAEYERAYPVMTMGYPAFDRRSYDPPSQVGIAWVLSYRDRRGQPHEVHLLRAGPPTSVSVLSDIPIWVSRDDPTVARWKKPPTKVDGWPIAWTVGAVLLGVGLVSSVFAGVRGRP